MFQPKHLLRQTVGTLAAIPILTPPWCQRGNRDWASQLCQNTKPICTTHPLSLIGAMVTWNLLGGRCSTLANWTTEYRFLEAKNCFTEFPVTLGSSASTHSVPRPEIDLVFVSQVTDSNPKPLRWGKFHITHILKKQLSILFSVKNTPPQDNP